MSYLDFPRLHFSGLFYTGPNTVNNYITSYDPTVPLTNAQQQYISDPKAFGAPAGWNPLGVAQWWLEECTVLSAVDSAGAPVTSDPVLNSSIQSPSPKTPMLDGTGGYYDLAKMVDLDTLQQSRSALYGVRIACILADKSGFQGLMTVPELRQLNGRISGAQSSWGAVGTWMGTLQNVQWTPNITSPFLNSLKAASPNGLNVKLTVDLHQNNPKNVFTAGDQFCYGRVLASIGPAAATELPEVVPGRCLQTFVPSSSPSVLTASIPKAQDGTPLAGRNLVVADMIALGEQRAGAQTTALTSAAPTPWNPAFAIIRSVQTPTGTQTLLSIDISACILLNASPPDKPVVSDGTFEVDSCVVGVFNLATKTFKAFVNGAININPEYQKLDTPTTPKITTLVKNSCVFTFQILPADGTSYQTNPLAIQVGGVTVAQEYSSGYWMDVSVSSQRLECGSGQTGQATLMVRKFGNPVANQPPPITYETDVVGPVDDTPTTDIGIVLGNTDANGLAPITTNVNAGSLNLPQYRQPLDSELCAVIMKDPDQNLIGDGNRYEPYELSVLLFNAYTVPTNPAWSDVSAIFGAYARMYPGMKSRFDISDQSTVMGDPETVLAHMDVDIGDPTYMPVTRDLSPSKMQMIVSWLKSQIKQS